jgi:hypothetical protein
MEVGVRDAKDTGKGVNGFFKIFVKNTVRE